ncbi:MAG: DNA translocase FtsK 4TM domain-containing protein [Elusimicrobiota bacterium]
MRDLAKNRAAAQGKKKTSPFAYALYWVASFAFSLWLAWVLFSSGPRGLLGDTVSAAFLSFLGKTAYFFPFIFLYGLVAILMKVNKPHKGVITLVAGTFLTLGSLSAGIQLLSSRFGPWEGSWQVAGGWLGYFLEQLLSKILGPIGAALFSAVLFFAGVQLLFKISWRRLLKVVSAAIASDYRDWTSARRELNSRLKNISEKQPAEGPVYDVKPIPEPPPVVRGKPDAGAQPEFVPPKTQIVRPAKAQESTARKAAGPAAAAGGAAADKETPHDPPELHFKDFKLPTPDLLDPVAEQGFVGPSDEEMAGAKKKLEETLKSFNISAYVADIYPGPVITRYEVTPAPGVKISSIVSLSNDLALAMKAAGIRVIAPIPGKSAIGFEIPNLKRAKVCLREVLESSEFNDRKEPLLFAIGRHAEGSMAMADLEGMPHLLVAGSTGSGKSVFLQSLIVSLMYRRTPDELKFVFIDPKRLELSSYQDIPYLYDPKETPDRVAVITDAKDAAKTLIALTKVMMKRYKKFERARVKNIAGYNKWAKANNEPQEYYIVVVIDELADLMVQAKNVVEENIQRLAQMARAVGIHLVLATQQPSVDVITGVIKANLPSRVALQVTSKVNSRVILDTGGAEALIGKGDLLYLTKDSPKPLRIQGAYVSEAEINKVVEYLKTQGKPHYTPLEEEEEGSVSGKGSSSEELLTALRLVLARRRVSQDLLKAHFGSSSRATNILSILEVNGFIQKPEGSNRWEIYFDKIESHLKAHEGDIIQPVAPTTPVAVQEETDL